MTVHELDEPSALAVFKKVVLKCPTQSIPGLLISKYELFYSTDIDTRRLVGSSDQAYSSGF